MLLAVPALPHAAGGIIAIVKPGHHIEIERKFLVADDRWRAVADGGIRYRQGYLARGTHATVRVRLGGGRAWLTIKGSTTGCSRDEWEYEIPGADADMLLQRACSGTVIDKTRYLLRDHGYLWEVDVFHGDNEGLVLAEVELKSETARPPLPDWVGREVTDDKRFYNAYLAVRPYCRWRESLHRAR